MGKVAVRLSPERGSNLKVCGLGFKVVFGLGLGIPGATW